MKEYWKSGLKKTRQRDCIFNILQNAKNPMTAIEIHSEAQKSSVNMWLSTIYRILDLFTGKGLVEKNFLVGDDIATYVLCSDMHSHFAVCVSCRKRFPMEYCPVGHVEPSGDFYVTGHKLEMVGYCKDCYIDRVKEGNI